MNRIEIEVDTHNLAAKVSHAISEGIKDSRSDIEDGIIDAAQDKLERENAIWRSEVYEGFIGVIYESGNNYYVRVENVAEHAPYVEWGAKPHRPPIRKLLPWVRDNIDYFVEGPRVIPDGGTDSDQSASSRYSDYTGEEVRIARHVQNAIAERGLEAIRYMFVAERWAARKSSRIVRNKIEKSMKEYL